MGKNSLDPILLEIFKNLFLSTAEEMGVSLCKSSFSPNIKERRDYSCAIFDKNAKMVSQAAHLPAHLGSMPMSVEHVIETMNLDPGDMVVLNDPFHGGNHLPDLTMISPIFIKRNRRFSLQYFVANRAHHADIGGIAPGSMSLTKEIFQDGLVIPPVKIVRKGIIQEDLLSIVLSNVRTPEERKGDVLAQISANLVGQRRIEMIIDRYGLKNTSFYTTELQRYSERMTRVAISKMPEGEFDFTDFMDDDGISENPVKISVKIIIRKDSIVADFTGSSLQTDGNINAVESIARTAVYYAIRCLIPFEIPNNSGCMEPIKVIAPFGTVVNSKFPSAVAGGNVETSQRMVDVVLGAMSKACPDKIPSASCGSMNNLTIGGNDIRSKKERRKPFAYYETTGGGMGAGKWGNGENAIHTHLTNTRNTPIEAIEHSYPLRVNKYGVRRKSGGKGLMTGGDGIIREIELLSSATVSFMTERRKFSPWALQGGFPGKKGKNSVLKKDGKRIKCKGKQRLYLEKGDIIRLETPGGGGWGKKKLN
tara:strand:- start:9299 stop:10903 length:1605 start_codon:yes stop_codon:yes gene_type:complete